MTPSGGKVAPFQANRIFTKSFQITRKHYEKLDIPCNFYYTVKSSQEYKLLKNLQFASRRLKLKIKTLIRWKIK